MLKLGSGKKWILQNWVLGKESEKKIYEKTWKKSWKNLNKKNLERSGFGSLFFYRASFQVQ